MKPWNKSRVVPLEFNEQTSSTATWSKRQKGARRRDEETAYSFGGSLSGNVQPDGTGWWRSSWPSWSSRLLPLAPLPRTLLLRPPSLSTRRLRLRVLWKAILLARLLCSALLLPAVLLRGLLLSRSDRTGGSDAKRTRPFRMNSSRPPGASSCWLTLAALRGCSSHPDEEVL
jgi:hypothetical protein